jgi:hypothetical protein
MKTKRKRPIGENLLRNAALSQTSFSAVERQGHARRQLQLQRDLKGENAKGRDTFYVLL